MKLKTVLPACLCACVVFVAVNAACPFKCYCEEKTVQCSANMDEEFPVFPPDTEKISLSQLNVRYLPVKAFSNLPNLKVLHITNSNIAEFQSCSVSDLKNLSKLIVDKSAIGNIESYAFQELRNIEEIKIENCRIGRIKPFAFYDIANITIWNMIKVHMRNVYADAFYNVFDIEHMVFHQNNFSDVVTNAFDQVSNITSFEAHENKFWNMQCGNLDDLKNAVTGNFHFSHNTFYCNCSVKWLLSDDARVKYDNILTENGCHGPDDILALKLANMSPIEFSSLNCVGPTHSSSVKCKEAERLTPKPKCPLPGQPSVDVVAEYEKEKDKDDGKNGANSVRQTNCLSQLGTLSLVTLFLFQT